MTPGRSTATVETPARPAATVEIESMTKGPPKVTVRIDNDDPFVASSRAFAVYVQTVEQLAEWQAGEEEE